MGEFADGGGGWPAGLGPGSRVAGYLLERQLAAGPVAVVFQARDERLNRPVALKIFVPGLAADEGFRREFLDESRAVAAVDDPHIIPVYDAGEAGGVLFIAMRYVPGGDAGALVRRAGPLPPARVEAIIAPVASALDAAHAAGLVHHDVRPANMLLDTRPGRADHVYLSDFGLGKAAPTSADLTPTGQFPAAADYISPEQVKGEPVDGRADQYALASAAFELLTGAPPFRRDHVLAELWALVSEPPPLLSSRRPDLPPEADRVFARALAKDPADRYPSCRDFAGALAEALGLLPGPGPDVPAAARPPAEPARPAAAGAAGEPVPMDEDVRFTIYRPPVLPAGQWASLLVFAHKTTPVAEPGRAPVDPQALVEARARAHFGGAPPHPVGNDARHGLVRGAQLRIVPELPGIACNPPQARLEWWEPMHEVLFRLLAGPGLAGTVVRGAVRVWCGQLIVGEVSVAMQVAADGPVAQAPPVAESAQRYRKIFPSYSHRDSSIVANFAEVARALGDDYLQDVLTLRAGERWHPRLLDLIEQADVFQLFWSRNSMRSPHCRDEWEHALALQRPQFVRPVYWEEPRPEDPGQGLPPQALQALHFVKVPAAKPEPQPPPAAGEGGAFTDSASRQPVSPGIPERHQAQSNRRTETGQPVTVPRHHQAPPSPRPRSQPPLLLAALIGLLLVVALIIALYVAGG